MKIKNNSGDYYNNSTRCWGPECAATEYDLSLCNNCDDIEDVLPEHVPATDEDCNDTELMLVVHCAYPVDARYYADDAHEASAGVI